jgi:hypothetical protein
VEHFILDQLDRAGLGHNTFTPGDTGQLEWHHTSYRHVPRRQRLRAGSLPRSKPRTLSSDLKSAAYHRPRTRRAASSTPVCGRVRRYPERFTHSGELPRKKTLQFRLEIGIIPP